MKRCAQTRCFVETDLRIGIVIIIEWQKHQQSTRESGQTTAPYLIIDGDVLAFAVAFIVSQRYIDRVCICVCVPLSRSLSLSLSLFLIFLSHFSSHFACRFNIQSGVYCAQWNALAQAVLRVLRLMRSVFFVSLSSYKWKQKIIGWFFFFAFLVHFHAFFVYSRFDLARCTHSHIYMYIFIRTHKLSFATVALMNRMENRSCRMHIFKMCDAKLQTANINQFWLATASNNNRKQFHWSLLCCTVHRWYSLQVCTI